MSAALDLMADFIPEPDLMQALGIRSDRTMRRLKQNGLPSVRVGGHSVYRIASVRAWLDAQENRKEVPK